MGDSDFEPGSVWLVGAGPGDPDLLTRKAERLIRTANVVFYDALVGPQVLEFARGRRVYVGKRSGRHSKDQASISRLIVAAALAGQRVVRLKGGDPAIFGRATEELDACRAAAVPVRICPGVTAASAAAADLGVSLTSRGTSRRLTFLTAHGKAGEPMELDWNALSDPQATLAIYMGKAAAGSVARGLLKAGRSAETPVALVENASRPDQRVFRTNLRWLALAARTVLAEGPAVILIGEGIAQAEGEVVPAKVDRMVAACDQIGSPT